MVAEAGNGEDALEKYRVLRPDIVPMDQVTLNFAKIEFEYHEQKPDGSLSGAVKTGYDLKQQKSS